jgi:hypothetical protein
MPNSPSRGDRVYPLPARCTFDEGATLPVAGLTAWQMVMNRACVRPGEAGRFNVPWPERILSVDTETHCGPFVLQAIWICHAGV